MLYFYFFFEQHLCVIYLIIFLNDTDLQEIVPEVIKINMDILFDSCYCYNKLEVLEY